MHIPDGFIDAKTALLTGALSAVGLGAALRSLKKRFPTRRTPLVGLAAAFVFSAQMLNFPVAGGTSGHLIGAVLIAVLLGPSAAVVALSTVLIIQCFMFADGGLTALGANIFNMAIVAPGVGFLIYQLLRRFHRDSTQGRLFATAVAAWTSTVMASVFCAGELAFSGTVQWKAVFPAMAGVHMLIGLGEAVITTLVVAAVWASRPELIPDQSHESLKSGLVEFVLYGILISVGLVLFIAPWASSWPDGLERVAALLGFEHRAAGKAVLLAPLPDYAVPGLHSPVASTVIAGAAGLLVVFIVATILARSLRLKKI